MASTRLFVAFLCNTTCGTTVTFTGEADTVVALSVPVTVMASRATASRDSVIVTAGWPGPTSTVVSIAPYPRTDTRRVAVPASRSVSRNRPSASVRTERCDPLSATLA